MKDYELAQEAAEIGMNLIARFHPHLIGHHVLYTFRYKEKKKAGKITWGTCKKATGFEAQYIASLRGWEDTHEFFIIELCMTTWARLSCAQKNALVDHELAHGGVEVNEETGEESLCIIAHDIEEFEAIIRRHGLWAPDCKSMAKVMAEAEDQGEFSFDEQDSRPRESDVTAELRADSDLANETMRRELERAQALAALKSNPPPPMNQ